MEHLKIRDTQREAIIWKCEQDQRAPREKLGCKGQEAAETINRHKVKRTHRARDEVMIS